MLEVKKAIISVSDKTGVVNFARELNKLGVEVISTGGTSKLLSSSGVEVKEVSKVTGFPEIMDGRVKTLHPKILAGILADKKNSSHLDELKNLDIETFDMVVVNLYPFQETVKKEGVTLDEAIENIDIGGVTLIRAASKNFRSVAVVTDPADYSEIINKLKKSERCLEEEFLLNLAKKAFCYTADYDDAIYEYFRGDEEDAPDLLTLRFEKIQNLRYGENPHQKAAFYRELNAPEGTLVSAKQLHGMELSFNNILDLDAAWSMVLEFQIPACAIIKHTNPCGVAVAENLLKAYEKALSSDEISAFGGIVAFNKEVDLALAQLVSKNFYEIVAAPAFHEEALEILIQKKNLRVMYMGEIHPRTHWHKDLRRVCGGLLVQDYDTKHVTRDQVKVVTERHPNEQEWEDLLFSSKVAKYVKSNAIVLAKDLATVGIGAGQMSRIDSAKIAIDKSQGKSVGAVLASDAFFPFSDVIEIAAEAGITAIIQPGGSIRDQESIDAANKHRMAMLFTGVRHFKH